MLHLGRRLERTPRHTATARFEHMGSIMELKLFRNEMGQSRGMGALLRLQQRSASSSCAEGIAAALDTA